MDGPLTSGTLEFYGNEGRWRRCAIGRDGRRPRWSGDMEVARTRDGQGAMDPGPGYFRPDFISRPAASRPEPATLTLTGQD